MRYRSFDLIVYENEAIILIREESIDNKTLLA
jgi:hypothetical protein